MRARAAGVLALAVLLAATAVVADAPASSPRPKASPVPVVTMSMAGQPRAATRPLARPAGVATDPEGPVAANGPGMPQPRSRPENVTAAPAVEPDVQATALGSLFPLVAVPRPPERPKRKMAPEDATIEDAAFQTQPSPAIITGRKGALCGDPALHGTAVPPIAGRLNGCGLTDGVKVTSVDGIPLSQPATVDCTTALALRSWVTDGLKPVIGTRGGGVARIEVAGSYACRPRNNQRGQTISEHGRGKAIDISGIILRNGEIITVLRDWGRGQQGKVLAGLHWMACRSFGTVLGPAANSFHRDHFHFDTAKNRRAGSYCR